MIFELAGSLGLFLYGMRIMSEGLQKAAGDKMKHVLHLMTGNRFVAVITGAVVTMLVQSSSATTVMLVSFVNAGLMTLQQAVGVIFGANIGTTVTAWIIALLGFTVDITILALIAIAVSLPMMYSKKVSIKNMAEVFLGFGLLFIGLHYMQASIPDLSGQVGVLKFLTALDSGSVWTMIICVVVGMVMTMILQASSAAMAITLTMAYNGWIGVYAATALCLGQNIGTTITAFLASVGGNTGAKRAAMAHVLFNVIGTVLAMLLFKPLLSLVGLICGYDIFALSGTALQQALPTYLAMFHTTFNVLNTLVFFPIVKPFCTLIEKIVPESAEYKENTYHFTYVASHMETPEIFILAIREEVKKMSQLAANMFDDYLEAFNGNCKDMPERVKKLKGMEEYADQMQEQLSGACVKLLQDSQTPTNANSLTTMIRIMDELESCTDSTMDLTIVSDRLYFEDGTLSKEAQEALHDLEDQVQKYLHFIDDRMNTTISLSEMQIAMDMEARINEARNRIGRQVELRLSRNEKTDVRLQLHILEQARHMEHIGDYCINIAESSFQLIKHAPVLEKTKVAGSSRSSSTAG
jgi:phosphate:Na+ symporter